MMNVRPILFTGEMVRAILAGRKTQTRRVVTVPWNRGRRCQPYLPYWDVGDGKVYGKDEYGDWHEYYQHGEPGDRLWVRETSMHIGNARCGLNNLTAKIKYRADKSTRTIDLGPNLTFFDAPTEKWWNTGKAPWKPSIFMPRWASRINLSVDAIRVERVQDISYIDIISEGLNVRTGEQQTDAAHKQWARDVFKDLWNSINEKRGYGWDKNPWVWVIKFKVIDTTEKA